MEQYQRKEVHIVHASSVLVEYNWQKCFSMQDADTLEEEEKEELKLLAGVRGTATWHTHTPASEQQRFANLAVLWHLHEGGTFNLVTETWKSSCLPSGEFVEYRGQLYFVVRTYAKAGLVWPALRGPHGTISFDVGVKRLEWLVVLGLHAC